MDSVNASILSHLIILLGQISQVKTCHSHLWPICSNCSSDDLFEETVPCNTIPSDTSIRHNSYTTRMNSATTAHFGTVSTSYASNPLNIGDTICRRCLTIQRPHCAGEVGGFGSRFSLEFEVLLSLDSKPGALASSKSSLFDDSRKGFCSSEASRKSEQQIAVNVSGLYC
ncbi:unnamed protein product [Protopolystoma xenopodis]|uniref:Uncharacterized protein n=1 Tax=Protopolystoma xenopodis TaxID=117903 RepID=A0A448WT86_9PLAT|nr:unnamed protein product [Protopolystoma xenopodis]